MALGQPYIVTGTIRNEGEISLILDELEPLSEVKTHKPGALRIRVATEGLPEEFYGSLHAELAKFPGNQPVLLDLQMPDAQALLKIRTIKVSMMPDLAKRIDTLSHGCASVVP